MPRKSWRTDDVDLAAREAAITVGGTANADTELHVAWMPNPGPQAAAFACPIEEVFYGGARGGGKSDLALGKAAKHCGEWGSRAKVIIFRHTYKELDELIERSRAIYTKLGARFYESNDALMWVFPPTEWDLEQGLLDGGTVKFRHLKKVSDAQSYQGHSYTLVIVDEAGNFPTPEGIDMLRATLRSPWEKHGMILQLLLTGNPGGPGHVWLKARYIKAAAPFTPIRYRPQPELMPDVWATAVFIPSKVSDNPQLDQRAYKIRLAQSAQGNVQLLKAWLLGDWDVFVGQAFWEWSEEAHVVPSTVQHLQDRFGWRWVAGLDWGVRKGAYVLAAIGPEGQIEVVLSLVLQKMDARKAARWVANKTRFFPTPEFIFTGEDLWQKSVDRGGKTLAELWARGSVDAYGREPGANPKLVRVSQGKGSRAVKYSLMHEFLGWTDERDEDGNLQPWAVPKMRFQRRCEYLTETIPSLPVDPDLPEEDIDTEADDHGYDACCMILLSRSHVEQVKEREHRQDRSSGFDLSKGVTGKVRGKRRKRPRFRMEDLAPDDGEGASTGWTAPGSTGLVELEDY